jgi:glycerol-3-phosphate acyltransferase PlsY
MREAMVLVFCYLMGSVPFGLIFARAKGVDLRTVGSRNIGATNALRAAGKAVAAMTLLGDLLKGVAAVALARAALNEGFVHPAGAIPPGAFEALAGLAAVLGHDYTVFLRFKGGKGVATSLGAVLLYAPMAGLATVGVWLVTVAATRVSSLGALVAFALMPAGVWFLGYGWEKGIISAIITLLLIYRHRTNIMSLIRGEERRVGKGA